MEETSPATHTEAQVNGAEASEPTDESNRDSKAVDRKHGKSFVYIGLKDCDDALRKIDPHEKQMSIGGFARALGHAAPKGRFNHKLDAMERFMLIEKDAESVRLTNLAIDMLYGGSETAKSRARATAFLSYPEFKRVFVECPKGQDNERAHIEDYVTAKLGIVNDVARFIRLFLESAHFAGLLEGAPNPSAKTFRLRVAPATAGMGSEATSPSASPHDDYSPLPIEDVEACLESVGLSEYGSRSEVRQRSVGNIKLEVNEGRITVTVDRPVRIVIRTNNALAELQQISASMQAKGLKA
ncbi:MAG: hypothetical protein IT430_19620 [Phycisphaerales bacterium]|nr:hypothetical protein [Phycisphaerales bacterium]